MAVAGGGGGAGAGGTDDLVPRPDFVVVAAAADHDKAEVRRVRGRPHEAPEPADAPAAGVLC